MSFTNTQTRIISAVVLIAVVVGCVLLGVTALKLLIGLLGLFIIDELHCQFFGVRRLGAIYLSSFAIFILGYGFFAFTFEMGLDFASLFMNTGLLINAILIFYLFFSPHGEFGKILRFIKLIPQLSALYMLVVCLCLSSLMLYPMWIDLLVVLLLINFGMDTGAWFFGRKFGRHKLWARVSPNKTIEGLIGGALTASVLGSAYWALRIGDKTAFAFTLFIGLGVISQIGDLVQSKFKRQFGIKDSSALIPGHGGVYDRVDSLIFVGPFFLKALNYLHF